MANNGNYRGVLVDSEQYRIIANTIQHKHVIHYNPPKNTSEMQNYLDKFWFRLGYERATTIVVASKPNNILNELIISGLIYDLRGMKLPSSDGALYDMMHEILTGKSTMISNCNKIRDVLAKHEFLRWCGAELESVFNEHVYANISEVCGNCIIGHYFSNINGVEGALPQVMNESYFRTEFRDLISFSTEDGQKKLGAIMYAIPRFGYDIIYVGGSPGKAWTRVLERRGFKGKVMVFDPEPLVLSNSCDLQIMHIDAEVHSIEDITSHPIFRIYASVGAKYIFIWDVRHSQARRMGSVSRNECIRREISELNQICGSAWFRDNVAIYQLKVNTILKCRRHSTSP
ncbi:unnamed protein product [Arctia plantaginis]|uniref:Uncharacterized protein n=1 Tax=Arctia plantaginis TaxID=874455 RepID=A0A8S1A6D4_ARCPL|nr:unnamed protein product [Arctia plantaginis]CAB3252722.1 unnamed protein product [Arctia plantaginis]